MQLPDLTRDQFSPNGSNQDFTLSATPTGAVMVFWNGLLQVSPGDYTLAGTALHTVFVAGALDTLCAIYGTVTGGTGGAGDLLATPTSGWREEWYSSHTNPANVTPFGLYEWDGENWVAGTSNSSIQSNPTDPNHFRYMTVQGDGGAGDGARVMFKLQQPLTTGAQWQSRIIFRLSATTNIRALAGFGQDTGSSPLAWFLGVGFDTSLGVPDTDFMFIAGASNVAAGARVFRPASQPIRFGTMRLLLGFPTRNSASRLMAARRSLLRQAARLTAALAYSPACGVLLHRQERARFRTIFLRFSTQDSFDDLLLHGRRWLDCFAQRYARLVMDAMGWQRMGCARSRFHGIEMGIIAIESAASHEVSRDVPDERRVASI